MSETIMDNVKALVAEYAAPLAEAGIACTTSKRYFEKRVTPHFRRRGLFSFVEYRLDERRERKYKNQHNRYHSVILRFAPTEQARNKRSNYKEYAFLLRKVERPYEGDAPQERVYKEERILRKIEKRLQKMQQKAAGRSANQTCRDTLWDALRYTYSRKYGYKDEVLGMDKSSFDLIVLIVSAGIVLASCLVAQIISK